MKYAINQDGKGLFTFEEQEAELQVDFIFEKSLAKLVHSLLEIKAMDNYAQKLGTPDPQVMMEHNDKLNYCKNILQYYSSVLPIENVSPKPLEEVSQEDIVKAYKTKDKQLVAQLYTGLMHKNS